MRLNFCWPRASLKATISRKPSRHPLPLSQAPGMVVACPVHPQQHGCGREVPGPQPPLVSCGTAWPRQRAGARLPSVPAGLSDPLSGGLGQTWGLGWSGESGARLDTEGAQWGSMLAGQTGFWNCRSHSPCTLPTSHCIPFPPVAPVCSHSILPS